MPATQLRVFEMNISLGSPGSVWTVTAWTTRAQTDAGKYTVRSDMSQDEFFELMEELSLKMARAHKAGDDFISAQTSNRNIVRDPTYPLPSETSDHISRAIEATNNMSALLTEMQTVVAPLRRRRRNRRNG